MPRKWYGFGNSRTKKADLSLEQRIAHVESLIKWLLTSSGVTFATVVGIAFWLGGMSNKLTTSSAKVDKVYELVLENKDSLASRTSVIETKLDSIDKKVSEMTPLQGRGRLVSARPVK